MPRKNRAPKFRYSLTDIEAVEIISTLPEDQQPILARVIWWDWFGLRLTGNRTAAFDKWLEWPDPELPRPEEPNWELMVPSLIKAGYPEWLAIKRLKPKSAHKTPKKVS